MTPGESELLSDGVVASCEPDAGVVVLVVPPDLRVLEVVQELRRTHKSAARFVVELLPDRSELL